MLIDELNKLEKILNSELTSKIISSKIENKELKIEVESDELNNVIKSSLCYLWKAVKDRTKSCGNTDKEVLCIEC